MALRSAAPLTPASGSRLQQGCVFVVHIANLDSNTPSVHGENRLHRRRCQLLRRNSSCCNHARVLPFFMTNCFLYHLNHGHLALHHNGNVDNLAQELHLCNLHDLLHNLNCWTCHCCTTGMFTTLSMKEITNRSCRRLQHETAVALTACDHSNECSLMSSYLDRCCKTCKDSQRNRH